LPPAKKAPPATRSSGANTLSESRKRLIFAASLLAVITLALYFPVTHHPFVNYDDDVYVTENSHVLKGLTTATVKWALTSTEHANWHPLTWMSHALDCSLFHLNAAGHHFTSVLLHVVNVVLLFLLLTWATGRFGPSLFVAALFALHPIEVESVAWVAERKNVLCTTFFLLTLWAYGWYAHKPDWKRYLAVAGLFVAGLASKPMVITLPFVLLLVDYWPLARTTLGSAKLGDIPRYPWSKLVLEKLPLLVLSAASAVITTRAQQSGGAMRSMEEFPLPVRVGNAIVSYAMYLWKTIWPVRLAPLYPHPGNSLGTWHVVVAAVILIAMTGFVIRFRDRRYLLVGWLWFLGTLMPVIGLVQVGEAAMADRYAYIPLLGIFVMFAFGVAEWSENHRKSQLAVVAPVILLPLAVLSYRQIGYWRSSVDLWSHTLAITANNSIAEDNLGGALILENKEEEAYPHFEAAMRVNPSDPMCHANLGTYFQSRHRMPEAIEQYRLAISLTSDGSLLSNAYANLGTAQRLLGEDDQAQKSFEQSLRLNSNQSIAWLGLGLLAEKRGEIGDAITNLSHSVEAQPTAEAYFHLGRLLTQVGYVPEAIDAYQRCLQLSPNLIEAQQAIDALRQQH
jgi:tetratricopeptide (TPR) repeat protein